jgi:hypothetical protein
MKGGVLNMAEKPKFEILRTNPAKKIGTTNYFMSTQKIVNDGGSSSEHFVLKKQGVNDDGSLRGQTRQLFIPIDDAEEVLASALDFVSK